MLSATKSFSLAVVMRFKLTLVLLAALVVCVITVNQDPPSFLDYKKKYGKSYTAASKAVKNETAAQATYKANAAAIVKHNADPKSTYKQSVNSNTDMTSKEVKKYRKGYKATNQTAAQNLRSSMGGKRNVNKKASNLKLKYPSGGKYQKSSGKKITTTKTTAKATTGKGTTGKGTTGKGTTGKATTGKGTTSKVTTGKATTGKGVTTKTTTKTTPKTTAKKVKRAAPTSTTRKIGRDAASGIILKRAWPVTLDYSK